MILRGHADLYRPAGRRDGRQHDRRRGPGRQSGGDLRHPLLDQLAGLEFVKALLEDQLDRRQLRYRLGPHVLETLDSIEGLLQRYGDQLLHVGGRQAEAGGLDHHARRRELGKRVNPCRGQRGNAEHHQQRTDGNDQEAVVQARADDPPHQGLTRLGLKRLGHHSSPLIPASAPTNSGAPTTTTWVPTGGPLLSWTVFPVIELISMGTRT